MKSINCVVLGDYGLASQLGKKGTSSDIVIYDRKSSDIVYTWAIPANFPDKIQPLIQAINMAEYAILDIKKIDRPLGEQIIALDSVNFRDGFIMHSFEVDRTKIDLLIKNTSIQNFNFVEGPDQLKQQINLLKPKVKDGPLRIPIDHAFEVKGIGTVLLGVVRQGTVRVHDELTIVPEGYNVLVKSIQMHDDPVQEASSPARVGIAIKGITADKISRGDLLCQKDTIKVSTGDLSLKFKKSSFFKGDIVEGHVYLASVGLQIKPVKVLNNNNNNNNNEDGILKISFEKPVAYDRGEICVLLKPDSQGTRIVGRGVIQ